MEHLCSGDSTYSSLDAWARAHDPRFLNPGPTDQHPPTASTLHLYYVFTPFLGWSMSGSSSGGFQVGERKLLL